MPEPADSPSLAPFLQEFLQQHHAPCPACRRDLHQTAGNPCPACGASLTLALASVESYRLAWGVLLGVMFISAAVGVFFATILIFLAGLHLRPSLWLPFIMFIVTIPLPAGLLMARRAFLRRSAWVQWALAAIGLAWTLSAFVILWHGLMR